MIREKNVNGVQVFKKITYIIRSCFTSVRRAKKKVENMKIIYIKKIVYICGKSISRFFCFSLVLVCNTTTFFKISFIISECMKLCSFCLFFFLYIFFFYNVKRRKTNQSHKNVILFNRTEQ